VDLDGKTLICRDCGEEFQFKRDKPGYVNQCEDCAEDVERVGGNMIWSHKTAPEIEIKPMEQAKQFAKASKRFGVVSTSVLMRTGGQLKEDD